MNYQTLELQADGAVATVWLNRPEVRNAFNETSIAEITDVFHMLHGRADIRVVVLAARGPAFCAGADLNWMRKMAGYSRDENLEDAGRLARMLRTIYQCAKPVIARVHGDCYAGGVGLAAACDIVVASYAANFCLSEVRLGLIPATISPYVIKAMGEQAARRYLMSGEVFTADRARMTGFVHEVIPSAELDIKVAGIVDALLKASPNAVGEAKRLVREVASEPVDDDLVKDTVERIADIRTSAEGREGMQSFLDKRKPAWA
jgi:methylglutaconyl-CoA hydratase